MPVLTRRDFLHGSAAGLLALGGCSRSEAPLTRRSLRFADYKALVCVDLQGGNDSYNLLVPHSTDKYELYARARQDLAVPREQLLALDAVAADGAAYGLHPACGGLRDLFQQRRAAILTNVGNLVQPTSKDDYRSGRVPLRLFSHSDQSDQWQTAEPVQQSSSGWAGRAADLMAEVNGVDGLPVNLSLGGSNPLQTGAHTSMLRFSSAGPQTLSKLHPDAKDTRDLRAAFDQLRVADQPAELESVYARVLDRGIRFNEIIARQLERAPALQTVFPANNELAAQLHMTARLIGVRGGLGVKRQIFYVRLGGFDTHNDQNQLQPVLFQRLSQALAAFYAATVELGVADAVTLFTASDFGRTLTTNGQGSDHGWSNHLLIAGGAVHGGGLYGRPPSLEVGGEDDAGSGRFIPQTATDEYAATLLRWFGVEGADLDSVLPHLGRFAGRDLGFMRS